MGRRRQCVCKHCGKLFIGDRYNYDRQQVCGEAVCQRAENALRQRRLRERRRCDPAGFDDFRMKEAERSRRNRARAKLASSSAAAVCHLPHWLSTPEGMQAALLGLLCQLTECSTVPDLSAAATSLARRSSRLTGVNPHFLRRKSTSYVTSAEYEKVAYVTSAEHEKGHILRT
jgi:hypothetical protein